MSIGTQETGVEYPAEDGQPMAETPVHVQAIYLLHQALEDFLLPRDPDAFIASDIFWYYEEGNQAARVAPDVMVVPGAGRDKRRSFFSWRERVAVPAAVFEMASEGTWQDDLEEKYSLYERLGVPEYYLFDPEGNYLRPSLQGFRLRDGIYRRMRQRDEGLVSALGLGLRGEGEMLRLFDTASHEPILTRLERAEQERLRAEQERLRATRAEQQAGNEKARGDALQAEVERLKALLQKYGHASGNTP